MNQQSSLEKRIGSLIATYADQAPTRVDGARVARLVASRYPARRGLLGLSLGGPLAAAIAIILVALMAVSIPIGAQLLRRPATVVTPDATATPSVPAPTEASGTPPIGAGVAPYLGMPPAGAQPTGGADGTLLVAFHARFADLAVMQYWLWLFADGRLIWLSEGGNHGHAPKGALVVQYLSPAGVEAFRSWVAANSRSINGLVTDTGVQFTGGPGVIWGGLTVDVDGLQTVATWGDEGFPARLVDPGAWLPASAWGDATVRGYVPARYAVCSWVDDKAADPGVAIDGFLPVDLLFIVRAGEVTPSLTAGAPICRTVDLDAAQAIVAALPADRIESAGNIGPRFNLVRTVLPSLGSPVGTAQKVTLDVSPMVPSGDIVCNCG